MSKTKLQSYYVGESLPRNLDIGTKLDHFIMRYFLQVYGSRDDLAISLRNLTNDFGRLREGPVNDYGKPLLPFNDRHEIDCRRDPRESGLGCFLAGDVRANEQVLDIL